MEKTTKITNKTMKTIQILVMIVNKLGLLKFIYYSPNSQQELCFCCVTY